MTVADETTKGTGATGDRSLNSRAEAAGTPATEYPDIWDRRLELGNSQDRLNPTHELNIRHKRLYLAVRHLLRTQFALDATGMIPPGPGGFALVVDFPDPNYRTRFLAVYGQLLLGGYEDPSLGRLERGIAGATDIVLTSGDGQDFGQPGFRVMIAREFVDAFSKAVQRYTTNQELYQQVYLQLREAGTGQAGGTADLSYVSAEQIAAVTQRLITRQVNPNDPQIVLHVKNAISSTVGGVLDADFSALDADPPDLDTGTAVEIIPDNVKAVRMIYYAAQLDQMRLFATMDKLVEHFQLGVAPIRRGSAADKLYRWIKRAPERITWSECRGLFGRVLGLAQGNASEPAPNREFSGLWLRLLSTVSQKFREVASTEREQVSVEQVHKAARDVAVNVSLHGYGQAHPAAVELKHVVEEVFAIMDEPEVLRAYGVADRYQLNDRVQASFLGGSPVNGVKFRTLAASGEKILNWLAESAPVLASGSAAGLKIVEWRDGARVPTARFTELAELCERWLAATGTTDAIVEQNTDPVDLRQQPTVPTLGSNGFSQVVQDALGGLGGALPTPALPTMPQA
jgi:hypothetical protein